MFIDDVFVTVGSCSSSHNIKHSLGYSSVLIRTLMSMFFCLPVVVRAGQRGESLSMLERPLLPHFLQQLSGCSQNLDSDMEW